MRVGELLANDGVFEGNQFTPPRYVSLMLKPTHKDSPRGFLARTSTVDFAAARCGVAGRRAESATVDGAVVAAVILRVGGEPVRRTAGMRR